jgi:hypothetical protein
MAKKPAEPSTYAGLHVQQARKTSLNGARKSVQRCVAFHWGSAASALSNTTSNLLCLCAKGYMHHLILVCWAFLQLPATLRVEPMRFGSGLPLEFVAGECLPETSVIVCNTSGQSMVRGIVAGAKYTFAISQRLWKVKDQTGILHQGLSQGAT